jgi:glycosyltransferase involved in cell wall biosynthesis
MKRVLFVARTRYSLPLDPSLARKWDALRERLDVRVLAAAAPRSSPSDGTFELAPALRPKALDGVFYYLALPFRVVRELRRFRPDVVVAQSPYEGAAVLAARLLARSKAKLVLDVHGDWRTFTRLYGSPLRRALDPAADRVAAAVVRRADGVRTVSDYTTGLVRELGREPAAVYPAYMDLRSFLDEPPAPLPDRPQALFVGVLERYKNVDGLAAAWRLAAPRVPDARLLLVGAGTMSEVPRRLVEELPEQTAWVERLSSPEIAHALDEAWFLVLPSRSEGMGRVVVEALARGRPVLGARVGGIRDLIENGVNGVLVPVGDTAALADALAGLLSDRAWVERLAGAARESALPWILSPEEFAARQAELVERVAGG